jgi:hypothetical protein
MLTENTKSSPSRAAPPDLARLCIEIENIAIREGLPGRGGASSGATRTASGGGPKIPHAAPSAELLQMALNHLPNQQGGPFDVRDVWVQLAHAVKGAATAAGFEAEGREMFIAWSQQWGGDADEPGRVWDGITDAATGWGTIMRTLEAANPAGHASVKLAIAQAAYAGQAATNAAAIKGSPFAPVRPIAPRQIPPRAWLYGFTTIKGFVSFLVAPGGVGKSALMMVEAVAMATGRELLPGEKPVRPLRVWMHNAEDDQDEMERRLAATLLHFRLTDADLNGNLFLTSGRDMTLQLARMGRDGPEIVPGVVDALVERLLCAKIDVLILDPLGALHTLPENSNEAANLLSGALREIAHRAGVAVVVLHQAGKAAATDMDAAGAGAARGASAFVDAARVVRQLVRMTGKEAAQLGIADADRRDFLRVENGKANLARAEHGRWLQMVDVPLGNGAGLWPLGDRVGVVARWTPPTGNPGTASDLARVQAAIVASPRRFRASQRSPDWIGWFVADVLALDTGGPSARKEDRTPAQAGALARVRAMVAGWVQSGGLVERHERDDESRKSWLYVFAGQPAVLLGPDGTDADGGAENAE